MFLSNLVYSIFNGDLKYNKEVDSRPWKFIYIIVDSDARGATGDGEIHGDGGPWLSVNKRKGIVTMEFTSLEVRDPLLTC